MIKSRRGFTIVEIMIVVAIVAVLMAMGIPNYLKARERARKETCIANLWQINEAIKQWVLENDIQEGASLTGSEDQVYSYIRFSRPVCPSGGTYTFGTVGQGAQVTCSKAQELGHELP